jgi:hypothetical protein
MNPFSHKGENKLFRNCDIDVHFVLIGKKELQ